MFNVALSKGIVDRNPATELYTPRDCKPGREKRVLDPADLVRMLDALNLREQVIFRLATCEGMRPGEILALQPADVHESFVSVTRRLYKGHIDSPKTKRSVRQVALTLGTSQLLHELEGVHHNRDGRNLAVFHPRAAIQSATIRYGGCIC